MSGNTLHAGSKFMGDKDSLKQGLSPIWQKTLHTYMRNVGDLKIFYDIDARGKVGRVFDSATEQEWYFESGNSYGIAKIGPNTSKEIKLKVDISLANDANGIGACEFEDIIE